MIERHLCSQPSGVLVYFYHEDGKVLLHCVAINVDIIRQNQLETGRVASQRQAAERPERLLMAIMSGRAQGQLSVSAGQTQTCFVFPLGVGSAEVLARPSSELWYMRDVLRRNPLSSFGCRRRQFNRIALSQGYKNQNCSNGGGAKKVEALQVP